MQKSTGLRIFAIALAVRSLFACLVWTPVSTSPDETLACMGIRSAYLLAAGKSYAQALPGSPAYADLEGKAGLIATARDFNVITPEFGSRISPEGLYPESLYPPGWPLLAAVLHRITSLPVWLVMQISGAVLDAGTCVLVYRLVALVFHERRLSATTGYLCAFFPPLAYSAVNLTPMVFGTFLVVLLTYLLVHSTHENSGSVSTRAAVSAGVLGGLVGYFRPDYLLIAPFMGLGLVMMRQSLVRAIFDAAVIGTVVIMMLLPWALRNFKVFGSPLITSTSLGATLVSGLGEHPNPWDLSCSNIERSQEARAAGFETPFGIEADRFFRKRYWKYIYERPDGFARAVVYRLWQPVATPHDWGIRSGYRTVGFSKLAQEGRILSSLPYIFLAFWPHLISAAIIFAGTLSILYVIAREGIRSPFGFLVLIPVYAAATHVLTHIEPRYLLPAAFVHLAALVYTADSLWCSLTPATTEAA